MTAFLAASDRDNLTVVKRGLLEPLDALIRSQLGTTRVRTPTFGSGLATTSLLNTGVIYWPQSALADVRQAWQGLAQSHALYGPVADFPLKPSLDAEPSLAEGIAKGGVTGVAQATQAFVLLTTPLAAKGAAMRFLTLANIDESPLLDTAALVGGSKTGFLWGFLAGVGYLAWLHREGIGHVVSKVRGALRQP